MHNGAVAPRAAPAGQGRGQPRERRVGYSVLLARASAKAAQRRGRGRSRPWRRTAMNESTRIYVTGSCDGLDQLREELANAPRDRLRRLERARRRGDARPRRRPSPGRRPRDPLDVVPRDRGRRDPRADAGSPIVVLASGESSALLEDALDAEGVADVLLLPQLTENVVFALRKAAHAGRRLVAEGAARPSRPHRHRVLAEGRDGQDGDGDEPRRLRSRRTRRSARSCSTSTSSSATPRSCSGSSRRRRSTTSSSPRASSTPRSSRAT